MNHDSLQRWLDHYLEAWRTNDPAAIGALFSDDAIYYRSAYSGPIHGRAAIVAFWQAEPDEPATWAAQYAPLVVEGDSGVAMGTTRYFSEPGSAEVSDEYANVFLVRFDAEGRCREFREWWMQRPKVG